MSEPKPFACAFQECGMTFTNEDHLHVHTKKHDMVLHLGSEQKNAFVADQTPTPTRFIRNCEEVGLFQDLQNVNPFDEGFKRAMDTKHLLTLDGAGASSDDVLHTPQMVFPLSDDAALYSSTNNQNITISRSSSDESGAVKEYETTTISKLTNEVTTISRVIEKQENVEDRHDDKEKVSYTNNIIKIQSNLEIRKDHIENNLPMKLIGAMDQRQPIMSQKSIDYVVDRFTNDQSGNKSGQKKVRQKKSEQLKDYEVLIKLPNSKLIKMKAVEEVEEKQTLRPDTKEKLKKVLSSKVEPPTINLPISGTLHPVTLVNSISMPILLTNNLQKIPIPLNSGIYQIGPKIRKMSETKSVSGNKSANETKSKHDDCVIVENKSDSKSDNRDCFDINEIRSQRSAASRRYRERLKSSMQTQKQESKQLREINQRLAAENAALKTLLMEHVKRCPNSDDLSYIKDLSNMTKPTQKKT